jgi:hypothetical protein
MRDVVRLIGVQTLGFGVGRMEFVSHVKTGQHRLQGEAVMGVRRGDVDEEGQSVRIGQHVHLGTWLARPARRG